MHFISESICRNVPLYFYHYYSIKINKYSVYIYAILDSNMSSPFICHRTGWDRFLLSDSEVHVNLKGKNALIIFLPRHIRPKLRCYYLTAKIYGIVIYFSRISTLPFKNSEVETVTKKWTLIKTGLVLYQKYILVLLKH